MQKNKNTKSRNLDFLVVLVCLLGVGLNVYFFWSDFNTTLTKLYDTPVGTITFKYKSAQRRFIDRVLWDRLRQESPVYNGDTIRTADLSEATVRFLSGEIIELSENSLVQIHTDDLRTRVNLAEGDISVNAQNAAHSFILAAGSSSIEVAAGAVVNAKTGTEGQGLDLRVIEGTASLRDAQGGVETAGAGSMISFLEDGTRSSEPMVAVVSPRPNTRMLSVIREEIPVQFSWNTINFTGGQEVRIEVSLDRNFSNPAAEATVSGETRTEIRLAPGTYWWRAYPQGAAPGAGGHPENAVSGRLTILYAPPPRVIAPAEEYQYWYRTRKPAVRFLWTALEQAAQYRIDIADNPGMENPRVSRRIRESSFIFSGLEGGRWYWQVTPIYPEDFEGTAYSSEVASFTITQGGELQAPVLTAPAAGSFINIAKERGDTYFSWKNDDEAASYTFRISRDQNLGNPVITEKVSENWYAYTVNQTALSAGQYYWGVYQTDIEGNESPVSPSRPVVALEGEVVYRTTFPPDGYTIADSLLPDIRFTWRSNLPFANRYQISADTGFTNILFDENISASGIQGRVLPPGEYYWRIAADTGSDAIQFSTVPKRFRVSAPLPAAEIINPIENARIIIREGQSIDFSWLPIPDAEYYQMKLYRKDGDDTIVHENLYNEGTSETVPMAAFEEGNYVWTVQAFINESAETSRRSGLIGTHSISMRMLKPVSLDYPSSGHRYQGLAALRTPDRIRWSSTENVVSSRFILSTSTNLANTRAIIMDTRNPGTNITLPRLTAGTYYWTVTAFTDDEFDISAGKWNSFTVLAIPPLAAPAMRSPQNNFIFGPAELRGMRTMAFEWAAVNGANAYIFSLYRNSSSGTPELLLKSDPQTNTSYTLSNLSILDRGTFTWRVEAVNRGRDGTIEQPGTPGESRFTINLPETERVQGRDPGALYGN
ncbi:FecR domain-containing protein [Breznakiella homolactica]|uniref:FecR domain-containing protein n=1 Tax=Breznakiella homolactica TaxID=2798577 RepID=A0A7T7XR27_9SPIR|nr:FecR domain-containing protein [Breznakiella homolactica]QQO10932.1 FecR family protein [Breznakiella homolactica]